MLRNRLLLAPLAVLAFIALGPTTRGEDESLDDLKQKAIAAASAKVAPSVVQIETSGGTEVVRAGPKGGLIRRGIGPTTGVIVSADGYIISSAFNFANKPTSIIVSVPGKKDKLVAKVIANDTTRMLTLLKVEAAGLPVPTAVPKKEIKLGYTAVALGRTLAGADETPSVSEGIVSAVERIWGKAIQTDAKVSPTNYGGPLIDLQGRVYGILVPASPRGEDEIAGFEWYDSGIGFAIPLEDVNNVLDKLKQGKDLKKGVLGITFQSQDPFATAPTVGTVAPGSPAEKAGIKPGDVITEVDGKPVNNRAQVQHQLGGKYEGDKVSLKVKRGDKVESFDNILLGGALAAPPAAFLGILPMRDDAEAGLEVRYVYEKSPAATAGLKAGDRILNVGRSVPGQPIGFQKVANREAMATFLQGAAPGWDIEVEVKRGDKKEKVKAKLGELTEAVPAKLPKEALEASKTFGKGEKKEEKKDGDEKKDEKEKEVGLIKRATAAADHNYWVYVPRNYDPKVSHALVVWLHPAQKNKDKDVEDFTDAWRDYCNDNHIIVLGPKSDGPNGWQPTDSEFVLEGMKWVTDNYNVDKRRVVAHGMGVGGQMAIYLGFNQRQQVRGVATTGAALTGTPKERQANQPLSFFMVAGGKDPLKDAISESKDKLTEYKYPIYLKVIPEMGHQYLDVETLDELIRWIDALDRM